jgi:hypothetical protein
MTPPDSRAEEMASLIFQELRRQSGGYEYVEKRDLAWVEIDGTFDLLALARAILATPVQQEGEDATDV